MSRIKILLLIIPCAMLAGVVIALVFLSSLGAGTDDIIQSTSAPAESSSFWVGAQASSTPLLPESLPLVPASLPPAEPEPEPEPEPADVPPQNLPTPAGFAQPPSLTLNGSSVTVNLKTVEKSTVNIVLATSGDEISVGSFYDYFSRDGQMDAAVEKRANFKAGPEGVDEVFEIPDTSKSYWLLINTVDNASGNWQSTVTAVPIFTGQ